MIPLLLMLAEAPATTPVDAERAFAADAKAIGQWTAFRKWSTDDAVMFVPQPTNAHEFLKGRKDPPKAIDWWPTASWIACDGSLAVNTGGWKRPDGSVGYFTTVWQRQADGRWKWIIDGGDSLTEPRPAPANPPVAIATCGAPSTSYEAQFICPMDSVCKLGHSKDGSLSWQWRVATGGARRFIASIWDGRTRRTVIDEHIPAPAK